MWGHSVFIFLLLTNSKKRTKNTKSQQVDYRNETASEGRRKGDETGERRTWEKIVIGHVWHGGGRNMGTTTMWKKVVN